MRILQLCKKFPYPVKDGETLAISYLSKALHELGCEVTLLAMNTKKHFFDIKKLPAAFNHYKNFYCTELDNELKVKDAFLNLFSKESYHISRFCCPQFEKKLTEILSNNDFDIVQLETLYLAPYIPIIRKYSKAKIAMRAHNVEHEIWQRISDNTRFWPKKIYLQHLTHKLESYERAQLAQYDILLPITQRDLDYFHKIGYQNEAFVTPIGIDVRDYMANDKSFHKNLSLSFIGSLDWMPNIEGLKWFLDHAWPRIHKLYPQLEFHIAGRNSPKWLLELKKPKVIVHGEVPSASEFINKHSVMVVPLLSGSGMRAKILEGMALGKVVLSTTIGLEGIDATDRSEVLYADTPEEFLESLDFCFSSNGQLKQIGQRAQVFTSKAYDNLEIAKGVLKAYMA